jgi:hypothetical protein
MTLKTVPGMDTAEGQRARADFEMRQAVASLAGNLLRIIAGGGKPQNVRTEAERLLAACNDPSTPENALVNGARDFDWRRHDDRYRAPTPADLDRWKRDGSLDRDERMEALATAALRWRAAQLLAQPTQESTAQRDLCSAAEYFVEWRPREIR